MEMLNASQQAFLKAATEKYHHNLEGSPGQEYLAERGLAEATKFRIGYVAEPLRGHEMFTGFLAIPYLRWSPDNGWAVASIRFRCIEQHEHTGHGKYMTAPGDKPRLYNTPALLKPSPVIAITEGEIDAVTAQLCGVPAVGVPGANSWQDHFREPFLGYREVLVLTDGDSAGAQFGHGIASVLPNAKVIPMPPGEDVNSVVVKHGKAALLERLK